MLSLNATSLTNLVFPLKETSIKKYSVDLNSSFLFSCELTDIKQVTKKETSIDYLRSFYIPKMTSIQNKSEDI